MKKINRLAVVEQSECKGCKLCTKLCPVLAINMVDGTAVIGRDKCMGCGACEQRCPFYAIKMQSQPTRFVSLREEDYDYNKIREICVKAHYYPEHILCTCTGTRAWEVAAAVLSGARSPEDISAMTGIRTGCKIVCIEPILRILKAADVDIVKPNGYQWYGLTVTLWDLPEEVVQKYNNHGYCFKEDREFIDSSLTYELEKEEQ